MRTLDDIRNNPAIMKYLRWDIDKNKIINQEFTPEDRGFYFYIIAGRKLCIGLLHVYPDGFYNQECIEGVPDDMIEDAVMEAGAPEGVFKHSGNTIYLPINKPIEDMLRAKLVKEVAEEKEEVSGIKGNVTSVEKDGDKRILRIEIQIPRKPFCPDAQDYKKEEQYETACGEYSKELGQYNKSIKDIDRLHIGEITLVQE